MTTPQWLPLLNYSTKYGVSLSTLRRRIKANTIQFKLESGKYFLLEESPQGPAPRKNISHHEQPANLEIQESSKNVSLNHHESVSLNSSSFVEASVLSSANRLVEEIKSAYAKILQEKEEQIAQFKEEVADLRMLVRILEESANNKKSPMNTPESIETVKSSDGDVFFGDFQNREI